MLWRGRLVGSELSILPGGPRRSTPRLGAQLLWHATLSHRFPLVAVPRDLIRSLESQGLRRRRHAGDVVILAVGVDLHRIAAEDEDGRKPNDVTWTGRG